MDWTRILYLITAVANVILLACESRLIRKTKGNLNDTEVLLNQVREMPDVVSCYECRFYLEGEPFCPKSGMKMKDGLIFCCYGERKEATDEGIDND